jgi:hypothetical protein
VYNSNRTIQYGILYWDVAKMEGENCQTVIRKAGSATALRRAREIYYQINIREAAFGADIRG